MVRLLLIFNLFFLNALACSGGYDSCIQKVRDAHVISGKSLSIPVKNNKRLIYSTKIPNAKILKHDPFLSLYLIEDKQKFAYPFDVNMRLQLGNAIVNDKVSKEGKIVKHQVGLNSLATYSEPLMTPSILTSSCCALEGIVTPKGIIEKEYIDRFLSSASEEYADIGVRVKDENRLIVVSASNPYLENNPLKKEDCVLEFDGVKVTSASELMRKILFSKIGSKHTIKIKRDAKIMDFNVVSSKRYGGGAISDTFLEQKGIYFDETLHIVRLSQHFQEYGLIIGDQLMQVNGVEVKNQAELLNYIENFKDFSSLLFTRRNFQFFVNIK